jgi:hypothetical protein
MGENAKNTRRAIGGEESLEYSKSSSKNHRYGRLFNVCLLRLSNRRDQNAEK